MSETDAVPPFGEQFPRLSRRLGEAGTDVTADTLDLSSEADALTLMRRIAEAQDAAAQRSFDEFLELSLDVHEDLLELRAEASGPGDAEAIDFLQFWVSLSPLATAVGRRELGPARDWAIRAVCDDRDPRKAGQQLNLERLPTFLRVANPACQLQAADTLLEWTAMFLYLARTTGDLPELADAIAATTLPLAINVLAASEAGPELQRSALAAAAQIGQWLQPRDPDAIRALVCLLDRFEEDERQQPDARKLAAIALAGPLGQETSTEPADRAERALERYDDDFEGHERLSMLVAACVGRPEHAVARMEEVLAAIAEHNEHLVRTTGADPVAVRYARTWMYGIIGGLVRTLAAAGRGAEALQVLCAWQSVGGCAVFE